MRYYSRSNQFRASHVVFDVNKMTAHSYGWWLFFSIINGTNVFNPYHYSISTSGHQRKVRELLHNLGIPIDLEIQSPEGLDDLTGALKSERSMLPEYEKNLKRARVEHRKAYWRDAANRSRKAITFIESLKGE